MPKISDLPQTGPITGAEQLVVVQGGATKRMPLGAFLEDTIEAVTAEANQAKEEAQQAVIAAGEILDDVGTAGAGQIAAVNAAGAGYLLTLESTVAAGALALSLAIHNQSEAVIIKQRLAALARGASPAVALAARVVNSGWTLEIDMAVTNAGGVFNPALVQLISYDKGFDRNCLPVIRPRLIAGTRAIRRASGSQAQLYSVTNGSVITYRISLDQQMFARAKPNSPGQTVNAGFAPILRLAQGWYSVGGNAAGEQDGISVANNSTEAYPPIAIRNAHVPWRLLGATGKFEITGNSIEATEGRVYAAARCDLTGQTSGVTRSQIVSAMIASDAFPQRTNVAPVFQANFDMSPFTQGERVTERWLAYPWIGDTPTDSATGVLANGDFANHEHVCNKNGTFPKVFAVVNPATGSDTTGAASTVSEAAAAATPFATDKAAVYRAWLLNQSAHGRNSQEGIEICFSDTTHVLKLRPTEFSSGSLAKFDAAEIPVSGTWCIYRPVTGAANCRLQRDPGGARALPRRTVLRGFAAIDNVSVTSGTPFMFDGGETASGSYGQMVWLDNSPILETSGTAATGICLYQMGLIYVTNTPFGNLGINTLAFGNVRHGFMLWRDSDVSGLVAMPAHACILSSAFNCTPGGFFAEQVAANTNVIVGRDNIVMAGVSIRHGGTGNNPLQYGARRATTRFGMLNVLVEVHGGAGLAAWQHSGDGVNLNTSCHFVDYLTTAGGRSNVGYEDSFTMADGGDAEGQLKRMMVYRRSVLHEINTKVDLHQGVAARVHTWNVAHRVGWKYVRVLQSSSDASTTTGTGLWFGEAAPASVQFIGPDARAQFTSWQADYQRGVVPAVVGTGGGNYVPAAGSVLLNVIPANDEACPIDIVGTARRGAVGAYERPL